MEGHRQSKTEQVGFRMAEQTRPRVATDLWAAEIKMVGGTMIIFTALAQLYRTAWAAAFTVLLGIAVTIVLLVYGVFYLFHPRTIKRYFQR